MHACGLEAITRWEQIVAKIDNSKYIITINKIYCVPFPGN